MTISHRFDLDYGVLRKTGTSVNGKRGHTRYEKKIDQWVDH